MPPSNIHRKSGRMPVPASAEVIVEHIATHPCGVNPETVECPCGEATAIVCADCGEPVFLAVTSWCAHAEELWRVRGQRPVTLTRKPTRRHRRRRTR